MWSAIPCSWAATTAPRAPGVWTHWSTHLLLAAAYANYGDMEKAATAKAEVLRAVPGYTISQLRAKRYSDHDAATHR